jgi:hypothetical protein
MAARERCAHIHLSRQAIRIGGDSLLARVDRFAVRHGMQACPNRHQPLLPGTRQRLAPTLHEQLGDLHGRNCQP